MKKVILMLSLICLLPLQARAASLDEQRRSIQKMQSDVLEQLYKHQPGAEQEVSKAAGYAVFSSADIAAVFVSGSFGHGLAHNNKTGKETYMKMASAGVGLGVGAKDFRAVFVFDNADAYHDFVTTGLDLSANADAAVKQGVKGGAVTGAADVIPGVHVYQLTETGLLAQVMLKGTKYWRDEDLNGSSVSSNTNANTYDKH